MRAHHRSILQDEPEGVGGSVKEYAGLVADI